MPIDTIWMHVPNPGTGTRELHDMCDLLADRLAARTKPRGLRIHDGRVPTPGLSVDQVKFGSSRLDVLISDPDVASDQFYARETKRAVIHAGNIQLNKLILSYPVGQHQSLVAPAVELILALIDEIDSLGPALYKSQQYAEAQHRSYEQLLARFDLEQMFVERYRQLALDQQEALKLAKRRVAYLTTAIDTLERSIADLIAAQATGNQALIQQSEKWLGKVGWFASGALFTAASTLGINLIFDKMDTSDERTAIASERSAEALERSADADEALLEAFKNPIEFGGKCYTSAFGVEPPPIDPVPTEKTDELKSS